MSDIPTTVEFLSTLQDRKQESPFRLGVVAELFPNSTAKIKFDGEETPSEKQYAYLASYMPALNDRVLLAKTAGTYVILGKVNYTESPADPAESYFVLDGDTIKTNYSLQVQGTIGVLDNIEGFISLINGLCVDGDFFHRGSRLGFFNEAPTTKTVLYPFTNPSTFTLNNAYTGINNIVNVLKSYGLF